MSEWCIRLETCPRCGYSLEGLPGSYRCPECGLEYDDRTFVLTGISRGTTSVGAGRKWLWFLAIGMAWLLSSFFPLFLPFMRGVSSLALAAIWLALVIFLIAGSRRERRGMESFIFSAGGFANCADLNPTLVATAEVTPWHAVDTVLIERRGGQWHRVRIGTGRMARGDLAQTRLDLGIRCAPETADWIYYALTERIEAAHPNSSTAP